MKQILYILLLATIVSCNSKNSSISYNIAVSVDSTIEEGTTAYLLTYNQNQPIDSAVVVNGRLSFSDTISQPSILRIDLKRRYANVLIENSEEVRVEMSCNNASVINDNGGVNDRFETINNEIEKKISLLRERYESLIKDGVSNEEVMKTIDLISFTGIEDYIIDNKDNTVGLYLLWQRLQLQAPSLSKTDSLINVVKLSNSLVAIAEIRENIAMAERTQVGKMFIDFEGQDIDDNSVKLSDYIGKGRYILVDFWASWCGPCMVELPNIKAAYNKFNGDNFTVVGINVWDKKTPFLKSIEDEQMPWHQIFTNGQEVTKLYGIQGIPELILFAPDGTILKRGVDIRGENLVEKIGEFITSKGDSK